MEPIARQQNSMSSRSLKTSSGSHRVVQFDIGNVDLEGRASATRADTTRNLAMPRSNGSRPDRRLKSAAVALLLSLALLAGCTTGSAPEANRGKQQDTQRESVISDMQATHTWDIINGTPESTPEATAPPE